MPPDAAGCRRLPPPRKRWSIGRIIEIGWWSLMIYVILFAFGVILRHDWITPTYFPDPTDGWVAPSRVVAPSTSSN